MYLDRQKALQPNYEAPFASREDAWKQLLVYHVFNTPLPAAPPEEEWQKEYQNKVKDFLARTDNINTESTTILKKTKTEIPQEEHNLTERLCYLLDKESLLYTRSEAAAQAQAMNRPPSEVPNNRAPTETPNRTPQEPPKEPNSSLSFY